MDVSIVARRTSSWADEILRAIQRGDYQNVLLNEAVSQGAEIVTSAEMTDIKTSQDGPQTLVFKDGKEIQADVIIGADGNWNHVSEVMMRKLTFNVC